MSKKTKSDAFSVIKLTDEIKTSKGTALQVKDARDKKDGALPEALKQQLDATINTIEDPEIRGGVLKFFLSYIDTTEFFHRPMTVRDIMQTVLIQESTEVKDRIKTAKLLPKLDDSNNSIDLTESDVEWLLGRVLKMPDNIIGSLISARLIGVLDPDGTVLERLDGTDSQQTT